MKNGQVKLICDAAYAFDYLAILLIKTLNDKDNLKKFEAWYECTRNLKKQLGTLFEKIVVSKEFQELKRANQKTFNLVERIRKIEPVRAEEIDKANLLRYKKKKALQKKFFGCDLQETKTKTI